MEDVIYSTAMLPKEKRKGQLNGSCNKANETYLHSTVVSMSNTKIKPFASFHFRTGRACTFLL